MDAVLQWGLDLIRLLQSVGGPALEIGFEIITTLGNEEFYLLLFPLLLWSVDFGFGVRLGVAFLLSSFINAGLKDLWMQPRPFDLDSSLQLSNAGGYGLPSGHSQSAVVVWGMLAKRMQRSWFWALAMIVMLLIGVSRIYLGVHFPTDVFGGWALGILLLAVVWRWGDALEDWVRDLGTGSQVLVALLLPLLLFAAHPVMDSAAPMAALAGMGIGLALFARSVRFSASGPIWQRAARFVLGSLAVAALFLGLRLVFPGEGEPLYLPFRLLRYGLIGLWVSLGAPWLFRAVGLVTRPAEAG